MSTKPLPSSTYTAVGLFQAEEGTAGEAAHRAAVLRRAGTEAAGAGEGGGGDAAEPVERHAEGDEGPAPKMEPSAHNPRLRFFQLHT